MNEVDLAWAAGFFEGEGCSYSCNGKGIRLQINNTDLDVMQKFCHIVNGRITGPYPRKNGHKDIYTWTEARQSKVIQIINWFWPHLGIRRRTKLLDLGFSS